MGLDLMAGAEQELGAPDEGPGPGPPPSYDSVVGQGERQDWGPSNPIGPRGVEESPPEYSVAASLPSYDQSELQKEKLFDEEDVESGDASSPERRPRRRATCCNWETSDEDVALLGNDFVFFTAFVTSFLFNWVGFLLLMCFCHTIAARYGALAGFGLSLAKWTLIVKRSTDFASGSDNTWLWWLFTTFGLIVCMRAIFQYLHIKRSWSTLSISARERLFFY